MKRHAWIALVLVLAWTLLAPQSSSAWVRSEGDCGAPSALTAPPPTGDDDGTFDPPVKPEGDPDGGQTKVSKDSGDQGTPTKQKGFSLGGLFESLLSALGSWLR